MSAFPLRYKGGYIYRAGQDGKEREIPAVRYVTSLTTELFEIFTRKFKKKKNAVVVKPLYRPTECRVALLTASHLVQLSQVKKGLILSPLVTSQE